MARRRPGTTQPELASDDTGPYTTRRPSSDTTDAYPEIAWIHHFPKPLAVENNHVNSESGPNQLSMTDSDRAPAEPNAYTGHAAIELESLPSDDIGDDTNDNNDFVAGLSALEESGTPLPHEAQLDPGPLQQDTSGLELFACAKEQSSTNMPINAAESDTTILLPSPSMFPDFTDQEFYYLQYLDEQAATQLLNVDSGAFNPLRRLILPKALYCPGVLHSVCAVAACHLAQRSDLDTSIDRDVIHTRFYLKSINWLRTMVGGQEDQLTTQSFPWDNSPVVASLLLCKYEIIRGSTTRWKNHLDGLDQLVQERGGIQSMDYDCGQYVASL